MIRSISSSRAVTITIGRREPVADRTAQVEPVGIGQLKVEDREPDVVLLEREQALDTPRRPDDAKAVLLEIGANERRDVLLVLDEQDRAAARRVRRAHAPARLSTLTIRRRAHPPRAVTATSAPGRASGSLAGHAAEPEAGARIERHGDVAPPAVRNVIAVLSSAVTTPRSVTVAGLPKARIDGGRRAAPVDDRGDEARAGCLRATTCTPFSFTRVRGRDRERHDAAVEGAQHDLARSRPTARLRGRSWDRPLRPMLAAGKRERQHGDRNDQRAERAGASCAASSRLMVSRSWCMRKQDVKRDS